MSMKKFNLIICAFLISLYGLAQTRSFLDVFEYEFDNKSNIVKEVRIYGNKYYTSLSLKNLFNNLTPGRSIADQDVLDYKKLFLANLNKSRKIKILFQKDNDGVIANIQSKSTYNKELVLKLKSRDIIFNDSIQPIVHIGFNAYSLSGIDNALYVGMSFNPLSFLEYTKLSLMQEFTDFKRIEKTSFITNLILSSKNMKYINWNISSNWIKYVYINGINYVSLNVSPRYDYEAITNAKLSSFNHKVSLDANFYGEYITKDVDVKGGLSFIIGGYVYPKITPVFDILGQLNVECRNKNHSLVSDNLLSINVFPVFNSLLFDQQKLHQLTFDTTYKTNRFMLSTKNRYISNSLKNWTPQLIFDISANSNLKDKISFRSSVGAGLKYFQNNFFVIESNLGFDFLKPQMVFEINISLNIR